MAKTPAAPGAKPARKPQRITERNFWFFFTVTDEAGNPVPNAKLDVRHVISDARKAMNFIDSPESANLQRVRYRHLINAKGEESGEKVADGSTA